MKDTDMFYPKNRQEWRMWLESNHVEKESVWLIMYMQKANQATVTWSEAVDEALCFGWIDSVKKKLDEHRSIQFFSKRKPKSTWSKINKDKIEKLTESGQMTESGLRCVEIAKQNGSWELLDSVEALVVPEDLETALLSRENAMEFFTGLNKTIKKGMLQWLVLAKRPETRQNRITEIAELAQKKQKPKQF